MSKLNLKVQCPICLDTITMKSKKDVLIGSCKHKGPSLTKSEWWIYGPEKELVEMGQRGEITIIK